MATIGNTIVDQQLQDNLDSCFTMEGQVLAIAGHDLAVPLQSLLHGRSIATFVLDETFGADVDDVIPGCLS